MRSIVLPTVLFVITLASAAQTSQDADRIRDVRATSNRAIGSSAIDAFAASLAPDFVVVTGNGSSLSREAYRAAFAKDFRGSWRHLAAAFGVVRFTRLRESRGLRSRSATICAG